MSIREDIPILVQKKKLEKKIHKLENKYDKSGPVDKLRIMRIAESINKKLEFINSILDR